MSIDATLYFTTTKPFADQELNLLAHRLYEAFYGEPFFFYGNRHCISRVEDDTIQQDGPEQVFNVPLYEVHIMSRYYGPDYERGNLPVINAICDWLDHNVSGTQIYYGGDSSGICAELYDKTKRDAMFKHFAQNGHRPYRAFFNNSSTTCTCTRCHVPMNNVGGSGNITFWSCGGCDEKAAGTNPFNPEKRWRDDKNDFSKAADEIRNS